MTRSKAPAQPRRLPLRHDASLCGYRQSLSQVLLDKKIAIKYFLPFAILGGLRPLTRSSHVDVFPQG